MASWQEYFVRHPNQAVKTPGAGGEGQRVLGGAVRGISKVLALSICLVLPVACTSMPAPRVSASRTCGPCVQECAHGGPQFHVATTGDDRNPGTERAPWRTIQKAMNAATTGATVHIAAGTYRGAFGGQRLGLAG